MERSRDSDEFSLIVLNRKSTPTLSEVLPDIGTLAFYLKQVCTITPKQVCTSTPKQVC